ncbi:MAG: hypothetical protein V3S14_12840, partial [Anaerolineae bacterium]
MCHCQITTVSISATQQARQRSPIMVAAQTVTIQVAASDDLSGIDTVYIGHTADFGGVTTFTAAEAAAGISWTLQDSSLVYVWARDKAGNLSASKVVQGETSYTIYLPLVVRNH